MLKKIIIVFVLSFLPFYFGLKLLSNQILSQEEKIYQDQSLFLHESIQDRFNIYLELPLSLGLIAADYLSTGDITSFNYQPFAQKILTVNEEILGLNILDINGQIIRVFPESTNSNALGKISQNIAALKLSYQKNEKFWFSSPFRLYQGKLGFIFYIPIIKNNKLNGWLAVVVSSENFYKNLNLKKT
ncbi:MAG: hypothetical protein AB7I27_16890 [Bacteriovoracaceae bacterium]